MPSHTPLIKLGFMLVIMVCVPVCVYEREHMSEVFMLDTEEIGY